MRGVAVKGATTIIRGSAVRIRRWDSFWWLRFEKNGNYSDRENFSEREYFSKFEFKLILELICPWNRLGKSSKFWFPVLSSLLRLKDELFWGQIIRCCLVTIQSQLSDFFTLALLDPDINESFTSEVTIYMTGVEPKEMSYRSGFTRCGKRDLGRFFARFFHLHANISNIPIYSKSGTSN